MNIAITGHRGLIGSYLVKRLEKEGHRIVLSVDLREGGDIRDLRDREFDGQIDILIHAAAHCKINESISNPQKTFNNDVEGTFAVFEFCRKNKIPRIVYFSSSRILSKERNPYTAAKIYGEELCRGYHDAYGINYTIIRPSTVYGPFWDETRRLMHIYIVNALQGKDLEIYGDPETKTLDFTFVEDFVEGVMLTINHPECDSFNISGNEEFRIKDLAERIIQETGSASKIVVREMETAQPQNVDLDLSKILRKGYAPQVKLIEGVKRNIEFCRKYMEENDL